jgi:hypothetical protein
LQQVIEDIGEQQPGEEHRQRHAGRGHDAAEMVDPGTLLHRRQHAERDGDTDGENEGDQRELGRGRQARRDLGHHRLAGAERVAEIAVRQVDDVTDELLGQRLVEPELGPDLGDRLRARRQPRKVRRRIARQQARQHEGDDDDPDDTGERRRQAGQEELQHGASPPPSHGGGREGEGHGQDACRNEIMTSELQHHL